jgi:ribosomal protein S18 acetylase RimI-like enzyme
MSYKAKLGGTTVTIRHFTPADAPRLVDLQRRCLQVSPDMNPLPGDFYLAPGFAGGKNILLARGAGKRLLGHVAIYPSHVSERLGGAQVLWFDLRADPAYEHAGLLKDLLLQAAVARAREIQHELHGQKVALSATYFIRGQASIDALRSRGFVPYESIYLMRRDLSLPLPEVPHPEGVEVRNWRMKSEAEQRAYLEAYNQVLRAGRRDLGELQYFMQSPMWSVGTTFSAFAGQQVVGSVMTYYDPTDKSAHGQVGSTEYIFVLPRWRRRGIARYLIREAMAYLKARGLAYAELEVVADNERALDLYKLLGYEVIQEEVSLGLLLDGPAPG